MLLQFLSFFLRFEHQYNTPRPNPNPPLFIFVFSTLPGSQSLIFLPLSLQKSLIFSSGFVLPFPLFSLFLFCLFAHYHIIGFTILIVSGRSVDESRIRSLARNQGFNRSHHTQTIMFSRMFGKPKQETNAVATLDKLNEVHYSSMLSDQGFYFFYFALFCYQTCHQSPQQLCLSTLN